MPTIILHDHCDSKFSKIHANTRPNSCGPDHEIFQKNSKIKENIGDFWEPLTFFVHLEVL